MKVSLSEVQPIGGMAETQGAGFGGVTQPLAASKPATKVKLTDVEPLAPAAPPKQRLSLYDFRRSPQTQQLLRSRDSKKFDEAMKLLDDADVIRGKKLPQGKSAVQVIGQGVTPPPDAEPKAKELEGRASNLINEIFPDGGYGRRWINDKEAADMGLLPKYRELDAFERNSAARSPSSKFGDGNKRRINNSTKTGRWYELDPKTAEWLVAKDQRESTERAVQAEEQKRLEGSVLPKSVQSLYTGMRQGANSVAGVGLRIAEGYGAVEPFTADNTVRRGQAMDAAAEKLQPGWFDRALRGTGSSGFQMATGGLAGPAGMIATFAATTANEKYTSAIDAGRTPEQAQSEAKTAALIEGGITTAFQLAGLGGLESVFQKGVTKSTVAPAIKNAIGRASKGTAEVFQAIGKALGPTGRRLAKGQIDEQLEELTVNTAQEFANRAQGYAPQDLPELWLDTIVGTAINMGIMQGAGEVNRRVAGTSDNQLLNDPEQARVWAATQPELAREIADAYAAGKPITRQMMNKAGLPRGDQEQRQAFGFAVTRAMANLAKGDKIIAEMNSGPSTQGPQPEKPEQPAAPQQQASDAEQAWKAAGERNAAYGVREGQYTPPQPEGPVSPQAADLAQAWQGVQPYTVPVAPEGAANAPQQPGQPTTVTAGYQVEGQDPSGPSILPNRITKADLRRETGGPAEGDYVQVEGRRGVLVAREGRSGTVRTEDGQTITDVKLEGLAWMRRPERPATSQEIERPMPVPDVEQPAAAQPQQTIQVPGIDTVAGWQGQQPFARPATQPQQQSNPAAGWETVTDPVIVTGEELELAQQIRDNQDAEKISQAVKGGRGVVRLKSGGSVQFGGTLGKAKTGGAVMQEADEAGPRRLIVSTGKGVVEIPLSDIAKIEQPSGKGKGKTLWEARGEAKTKVSQPDQAAAAAPQQEASPVEPTKKAAFGKRDGVVERRDLGVKDGAGLGVTEAENAGLGAAVSAADAKRTERIQKALEKFIPGVQVAIAEDNAGFEITLPRNGRRVRFVRVEQITPRPGQKAYGAFTLISDTMLADGSSDVSRFGDGLVAISEHFDADLKYSRKSPFGRVDSDRTRLETTVLHEMLHAALAFGLIDKNSKEWQELARTYGRTKNADGSPVTALQIEEDVVTSIEDWYANSGLFDRVVQFFVAIADALKVGGFLPKSVAITRARIVGGQVFSRPSNTAQSKSQWAASLMSTVQFSVAEQTESEAFKRWFGNSKVVDENGRPKVVYHGTSQKALTEFKSGRDSMRMLMFAEFPVKTQGHFFSENRDDAESYGRNVIPAYLKIEKPLVPLSEQVFSSRTPDHNRKIYGDYEYILEPLIENQDGKDVIDLMGEVFVRVTPAVRESGSWVDKVAGDSLHWSIFDNPEVAKRMRERGYDGAKVWEPNDQSGSSWFAMDATQIKSATSNTGTFDPNNPSIMFSVADAAEAGADPVELEQAAEAWRTLKTQSPWFKSWFGNSVVADEYGNPREVFHGSASNFLEVDRNKGEFGFHVGTLEQAEERADAKANTSYDFVTQRVTRIGANVMPLYVRIENPVRLQDRGNWNGGDILKQLIDRGIVTMDEAVATAPPKDVAPDDMADYRKARVIELLQSKGYDGVVYLNRYENTITSPDVILDAYQLSDEKFAEKYPQAADSYIVFNPEQVKSSIGNRGTFDPNSPSMVFSEVSQIPPELRTTVSTRKPSAKGKEDLSYREELIVNSEELFGSPERQATLQSQMGNFIALAETDDDGNPKSTNDLLKELYNSIVENLLWLHDHMQPAVRARAKLWYDVAKRITEGWAKKFSLDQRQVAGIIAVLSPQMDWFRNVSLAERAMRILRDHGDETWSDGMTQWFESWVNAAETVSDKNKRRAHFATAMRIRDSGLTLNQLPVEDTGHFIRAFDEAYFSRKYRLVTPEGGFGAWAEKENALGEEDFEVTEDGDKITPGAVTWSGFATIAKTAAIFRAVPGVDLMRVLDDRLGAEHKVRNFYNNIIDPNSKAGHVTIDSHAAAAAYIRATSGADVTTAMSLGAKGGKSAAAGSSGLYGLVADAYREAAAKRGILAREMQSITWEAVRSLFPAKAKRVGTFKADIDKVWDRVRRGELSATEAREEISKYAGGIKPISWEGTPEGVGVEDGGASFDGVLSPDPAERQVRTLKEEVAMDSIRVSLSAATTAIPGIKALHDRARAGDLMAHQLLQDVAFDNLKNLMAGVPNVSIRKVPVTGLYGGDIEPSLALTVRFGEESRDLVMPRLKKFADNFNQQQIHVRKSAGKKDLYKPAAADGSYVTPVVRITHKDSLTTAQVQAIIEAVNGITVKRPRGPFQPGPRKLGKKQLADHNPFVLEGLTVGDGFIEAYYVGKPEDQRAIKRWVASIKQLDASLGDGNRRTDFSYARLWPYGDGKNGIGWDGLPSYVPAPGEASKDLISQKTTERIAKYLLRVGDTPGKVTPFHQAPKITKEQARLQRRIMEIYESLPDNDLKRAIVKKAYKEAAAAILEQYLALPIQVEVQLKRDADKNPIRDEQGNLIAAAFDEGEPYENSAEMRRDVAVNNHMFVFGTTPNSFGPEGVDFSFHPLLQKPMVRNAEGKLEQLKDINGYPLLYNDLLRAVHDYFAHTLSPAEFGPKGEEAAWANHMAVTMNPWARWAITTETRGQNSWVNFRPGVEKLTKLERGFARQKAVLLPIEYTYTGNAKIDKVMKEFEKSLTQAERMGSAKSKTLAGTIAKADAVAMLYSNESAESLDHLYKRPKQNKVSNLFRWLFTSRGELPQSAYTLKEHMHGYIASHEKRMEFVMRDLKKAVKQVYGEVPELNSRDWNIISNVLRGGDPNMLPLPMRDPVVRMRKHVDELSRAIIESGAASEGLAATIDQNLGVYLTRTYRVFSDKNWKHKVPAEVKARFIRFLEQQYPDASENQLQQIMNELLNKDSGAPAKALSGKLGAKLLDVLKAKKNLPEELRELWGEETNPLINYAASISKMTKLVAGHQFLTEAREAGLGKWLFEKDDPNIDPEASTKIAAEGSHPMAPLNGLRTYPEILEAFENEYKMPPIAYGWRWYFTLNSVAKAAKTVGSSVTQIRNFWSNVGMVAANGNWQAGNLRKALKAARPQLEAILGRSRASDADTWREFHTRLTELGVVGEEVGIGELKQLLSDAALEGESKWLNNAMVRTGKAVAEGAAELYQWSDNFWKAYAWLNERAKYQKAFPEASSEWLDRTAANIVRDTMPTYGRIPKGIQYLRRIPLGNFFAWPAEIVRTVLKAWQLAFNEIQDPATRAIGAQRMFGLFGAVVAPAATKMALQLLLGFTDEDDEDRREFVPPWSKNSLIAWFDDGTYLDMSYLDPYSYLRKPFLAVLYGENVVDGAVQAATELASPFFSEQLLGERIADVTIRQGVTKDGRMVYNPQDEFSDKASAVLLHVLEPTVPAVLTGLRNIWLGATGKTGDQGKVYDPMIEFTSMVSGARISKIDIEQSLSFQIGDYDKAIEQANSIVGRTAVNRGSISSEELSDAYRRTDNARRRNFAVMHDKVHAALRQGVPEEHVRQLMKDRKMSDVDIEALISGEYKPYMPGASSLEVIASRPDGARRVADLQTLWIANSPNPQDAQGDLQEAEMKRLKNAYATLRSAGNVEAARKRAAFKRGETPEARAARMAEYARGVTEAQQEVERLAPRYQEVFGGKR